MKAYLVLSLLFILIVSCASKTGTKTVEEYYTPTGVDKYFLTDIPSWANFDQKAQCYRDSDLRYFNIDALMKSYGISYADALQIQATFNEDFIKLRRSLKTQVPMLKEEEILFYKSNEKVSSKIIFFSAPEFQRINLIWFDEIIGDPKKEQKLKDFLRSSINDEGVPLLVSFCLTREAIEKKYPDINAKMITSELFSVYEKDGRMTPGFKFDLSGFFRPNQKIYFYSQKKEMAPAEVLKGTTKIFNY